MDGKINIFKNGFFSIVGTFLIKAVNFISIPIFARMLSVQDFGSVNIFMTYVSMLVIILGLDFHGAVSKGQLEFEKDAHGFMSVGLFFTMIFSAVIILLINIFHSFFEELFQMSHLLLNVLFLYSFASFIVTFFSTELIFYFKYKQNTLLSMGVSVFNFICSVVLMKTLYRGSPFWGRIWGAAIPTILIALGVLIFIIFRGEKIWNSEYLKFYLKMGIPLIPHNLSHLILGNADKIMISNMISEAANGIYSLVYNVGWILSILVEALNNVWIPWLFRKLKNKEKNELPKMFSGYAIFFSLIVIMLECISPELVMILGSEEYWEGKKFVIWIVYATYLSFLYTLYVNIEFYEKKTYIISLGTVMAAVINIVLNILFLEHYGYMFAAISTVLSYMALMIFHMCIVTYVLKVKVIRNKVMLWLAVIVFMVSCMMQMLIQFIWIRLILFLILGVVIIFMFSRIVKSKEQFNF